MKILKCLALSALLMIASLPCSLADTMILPADLTVIETRAFYGDASLDEVFIPEGVKRIEQEAFAESSVQFITLPASLEYIAEDAFSGVTGLTAKCVEGSYAQDFCASAGIALKTNTYSQYLHTYIVASGQTSDPGLDDLIYEKILAKNTNENSDIYLHQGFDNISVQGQNIMLSAAATDDILIVDVLNSYVTSYYAERINSMVPILYYDTDPGSAATVPYGNIFIRKAENSTMTVEAFADLIAEIALTRYTTGEWLTGTGLRIGADGYTVTVP